MEASLIASAGQNIRTEQPSLFRGLGAPKLRSALNGFLLEAFSSMNPCSTRTSGADLEACSNHSHSAHGGGAARLLCKGGNVCPQPMPNWVKKPWVGAEPFQVTSPIS